MSAPHQTPRRPPAGQDALIEVRELSVRYGGVVALRGVSTQLARGRITAIVGPSGCGKSSFLACLNRLQDLVPSAAVSGSIRIEGEEVLAPSADVVALRRRVGMIFQRPNPFPMSTRRNLELALVGHGMSSRAERAVVVERVLRDVGLWDEVGARLDAPALALSGGQQQRLCIARALALEPSVLLLDEPCSALDPISSRVVEDLIASMRGRYTLVIVTHNLAQARRIADEVLVFWLKDGAGALIEQGPTEQIFEAPRDPLTAAYVGGVRG